VPNLDLLKKELWNENLAKKRKKTQQIESRQAPNCVPGCQNRVATLQKGGRYVNDMPNSVCFTLANLMENTGGLSSSIIS
jgi:hypothetical protein